MSCSNDRNVKNKTLLIQRLNFLIRNDCLNRKKKPLKSKD
nr:MAG TPA: hypothetical protein [Caudoviricetes sp.]